METQRRSIEIASEASYCERETWEDWGSRSSLSHVEEVATQSSGRESAPGLRAERDSLALALAAERQRAAAAARAHDARLAELHGVIAELLRRRDQDKHAAAIPEEELSDECESTTQPAGELENDADRSRTEQNDSSSILSPSDLPTPQEPNVPPDLPEDTSDSSHEVHVGIPKLRVEVTAPIPPPTDTSLNLSERDSELCLSTARCCQSARGHSASADSCEREHGSPEGAKLYPTSPGRCESRQAKIASRVRLRRTEDADSNQLSSEEAWCAEAAERLALDVCAQADYREALVAAHHDGAGVQAWRARCARLRADRRVLRCALARACDTAHRLYTSCSVQESSAVSLCCALKAADRALEVYDVLLALAETQHGGDERAAAELVAQQLLGRLQVEDEGAAIGEPLLSPGPWLQHQHQDVCGAVWGEEGEARLRAHAARLKAASVALRRQHPPPHLFSYHDIEEEDIPKASATFSMAEMEAAVMMQEVLSARERAEAPKHSEPSHHYIEHKSDSGRSRRRRERHWLDTQASETDL